MEYEAPKVIVERPNPVFNTTHFAKKEVPKRTTMIVAPRK